MADNYKKKNTDDKEKRKGGLLKSNKILYLGTAATIAMLGVTMGVLIHPVVPILGALGIGAHLLQVAAGYINDKITEKEIKEKYRSHRNHNPKIEDGEKCLEDYDYNEIDFKC